jgi:hypothetical protein
MKTVRHWSDDGELLSEQECNSTDEVNQAISGMLWIADDEGGTVEITEEDGSVWTPV